MSVPSALIVTVPLPALAAVIVSGSPPGSRSLPSTSMRTASSSRVSVTSFNATGGRLTTRNSTVAVAALPFASVAVTIVR